MSEQQQQKQAFARAAALDPPIPMAAAERAAKTLAGLDAVFQQATGRIPAEELMWDGPDFTPGPSEKAPRNKSESGPSQKG